MYPREMNTYADRGNIAVFNFRLKWRKMNLEVIELGLGDPISTELSKNIDFIYMGGGQDRDQEIISADLMATKAAAVKELCLSGIPALFVCGGYQLTGNNYLTPQKSVEDTGKSLPGLGILDIHTVGNTVEAGSKNRLVGNIRIKAQLSDRKFEIQGYENHNGRTFIGNSGHTVPLGRVISGHGNNGKDKTEGAVFNKTIGTYIHGPLLPKNPELADLLISWGLQQRYKEFVQLAELDDSFAELARK